MNLAVEIGTDYSVLLDDANGLMGTTSAPPSQTLNLKNLLTELLPVAVEWQNIGVLLGLINYKLDIIKEDSHRTTDQLRKMLGEWLTMIDPPPSWNLLVQAVGKFNPMIAKQISDKYCSS